MHRVYEKTVYFYPPARLPPDGGVSGAGPGAAVHVLHALLGGQPPPPPRPSIHRTPHQQPALYT